MLSASILFFFFRGKLTSLVNLGVNFGCFCESSSEILSFFCFCMIFEASVSYLCCGLYILENSIGLSLMYTCDLSEKKADKVVEDSFRSLVPLMPKVAGVFYVNFV